MPQAWQFFLCKLAILVIFVAGQNILITKSLALEMTNSGSAVLALNSISFPFAKSLAPNFMDEVLQNNADLGKAIVRLKAVSNELGCKIEENLHGIRWHFLKPSERPKMHLELGEAEIEAQLFQNMSPFIQAKFFLTNSLRYEILRRDSVITEEKALRVDNLVARLLGGSDTGRKLSSLIKAEVAFAKISEFWVFELIQSRTGLNEGGVLFARRNIRFIVSFCSEETVAEIRARQMELGIQDHFKGAQVYLEKLALSKKCQSIDNQFYTLNMRKILPLFEESLWIRAGKAVDSFFSLETIMKPLRFIEEKGISNILTASLEKYVAKTQTSAEVTPATQLKGINHASVWDGTTNSKLELTVLNHSGSIRSIYKTSDSIYIYLSSLKFGIDSLKINGFLGSIYLRKESL